MALDASRWDEHYAEHDPDRLAEPSAHVVAETSHLTPGRALDLAGGQGRHAIWLARRGWDVTAVDYSPVGLAQGERLAGRHDVTVRWVEADLSTYEPPAARFDLVLLAYLHVAPELLGRILRSAAVALAPTGRLVVIGYDRSNRERDRRGPPDPALLYDLQTLTTALEPLTVERAERVERRIDIGDGASATAVDAIVRARFPP